jgi:hypothetical protein
MRFKYGQIIVSSRMQGKILVEMIPKESFENVVNLKYFEIKWQIELRSWRNKEHIEFY